jgi:hypothetical protein
MLPQVSPAALVGIIGASLRAVFAFIGFQALVNVAEELDEPGARCRTRSSSRWR